MSKISFNNSHTPSNLKKRIVRTVLIAAAAIFAVYMVWYLIYYKFNKSYRKDISDSLYEYEQGREISFIKETNPSVPGYQLVCENDTLKLYTDPNTTYIAVYDKRNKQITYSNPLGADSDKLANNTNKDFLKSQMIIYYYNDTCSVAHMDSYSKSVKKNQFSYEGIRDGIRYLYTIGETKPIVDKDTGVESENNYFEVALEYRLDGDSVVVSVPAKGITEHGHVYIYRIQLLRYMGATTYTDEGYMVVPNGSGSIIEFNKGKKGDAAYSQYIYEIDPMISNYTTMEVTKGARLPIYGICSQDKTILAEVLGGATVASINASQAGTFNSYNFVYPIFVVRNADNLVMFGNASSDTYVMEQNIYDLNYSVRYSFLDDNHSGYSGIANYYREKLIEAGKLTPIETAGDIPFYYDIIAGVKEVGHFLGVRYFHTFSMTNFKEAGEIAEDLASKGISNQVMNLQGWFNGGYYHDTAKKINVIGKLGGKSGLEELNETVSSLGGRMYADVAFQKVTFADDDFNYSAESSRYYGGGYVAAFGLIDPSTFRNTSSLGYRENMYDMLSPRFLHRYTTKFAKKIQKYDIDGISLRDLGNTLTSDKVRTDVVNRDAALDIVNAQLEKLEYSGKSILMNSPNAYAFQYSDEIINVPYEHNAFIMCDASIPLYQMILHGCVNYSSELLNDENEYNNDLLYLHLIETGSAPHFQFTMKSANEMKETGLNRFYSTTYSTMQDNARTVYSVVNEVLKHVSNAQIINHKIEGTLRAVTYSNGVVIYVNYGDEDGTINGVTVPAKGYRMEGIR